MDSVESLLLDRGKSTSPVDENIQCMNKLYLKLPKIFFLINLVHVGPLKILRKLLMIYHKIEIFPGTDGN